MPPRPHGGPAKAQMLYYDDARHANLYLVEPDGGEPSLLDVLHPVDVVANTAVDTFVFGLGIGGTMSYGTDAGELWFAPEASGPDAGTIPNATNWRARQSVQALLEQGLDPLTMLVEQAHRRRMTFYASLRLGANNVKGAVATHGNNATDFTNPEAREERMALLEEALTKYQVDGVELDCDMGGGLLFDPENLDDGIGVLTSFVADVREMVDAEATRRGRPVALGLRILPTLAGSLQLGVDVSAILSAGLLDFIVPLFYVNEHMDPMLAVEPLAALAHQHQAWCYPAVRPFHLKEPRMGWAGHASTAMYRACAVNYLSQGADALYMMQLNWPSCAIDDEFRVLLCYCAELEMMHRMPRHYFVTPQQESAAEYDYTSPLPLALSTVGPAPTAGQSFSFYVGDNLPSDYSAGRLRSVVLRLRIESVSTADDIDVLLNGRLLPSAGRMFDPVSYNYAWISYPMLAASAETCPLHGANQIEVALRARPPLLGAEVVLAECELLVEFIQQRNRTPYDLWRPVGGPSNSSRL